MSRILHIETATQNCSVSLSENGKLLAFKEQTGNYTHAENLTVFIQQVLEEANLNFKQLDAVSVSKGPGSYTGLRIGVSTAKGICFALEIPLIAVDTLKSMTKGVLLNQIEADLFCPMIDARRMEVYAEIVDRKLNLVRSVNADIVDENTYSEFLRENSVCFFGNGMIKCKEILSTFNNSIFVEGIEPSAKYMIEMATEKFLKKEFEDVAYFEPHYLKDFIAGKPKKLL